jgi:endonuclease YncB( thermonuclease family)
MPLPLRSKLSSLLSILILLSALGLWVYDALRDTDFLSETGSDKNPVSESNHQIRDLEVIGKYEVYRNCRLVKDRSNDGDSFRVELPNGKTEVIRLYYVDAPESAFKTYGGGRNNHERIADQAYDMGRISSEQAVQIGKIAKEFALNHLAKSPFTIYTEWDDPFGDKRYHAFVEISYHGKPRYLHELLIEKGYARIHTKGAILPDDTSVEKHKSYLRRLKDKQ